MLNNNQKRENAETVIRALLVTQKGGCTMSCLDNYYYEQERERIPWKSLGYVSLLSFLLSMPNVASVDTRYENPIVRGIASEKSKHIRNLVAGQKSQPRKHSQGRKIFRPSQYYPHAPRPKVHVPADVLTLVVQMIAKYPEGIGKDYILNVIQKHMTHVNITMKDVEEQLRELSHKLHVRENKIYPILDRKTDSVNTNKFMDKVETNSRMAMEECTSRLVVPGGDEEHTGFSDCDNDEEYKFLPPGGALQPSVSEKNKILKSTSSFIQESVFKYENQIFVDARTEDSKQPEEQNCLDSWHYDYANGQVNKEDDYDTFYDDVQNVNKNVEILINDRTKFRLEKLVQNNPDGIWCADLPEKYLEEYKVSLNYIELGFSSVREFASYLPDIFHCVQPNGTGDYKLYFAKNEIPCSGKKETRQTLTLAELHNIYPDGSEIEALPLTASRDTCTGLIPDHVMTIGESVGQVSALALAKGTTLYVEVVVVEVFTPSFFWIQLRKNQKMFKTFMDDLNIFYISECKNYKIPPVILERGLNCVCKYGKIWHRGIIKTITPDLQVTVFFYDYGTLKTYPAEEIHYLHRKFNNIPAQAIPCGLINTKPCNGTKWSFSTTHQFALRTSQRALIATIASVYPEDNSLMVSLTDTLEEEDVHINDWLVENNLAKHGKMVCMKFRNFPFQYYLKCRECSRENSEPLRSLTKKLSKINRSFVDENNSKKMVALYDPYIKVNSTTFDLKEGLTEDNLNAVVSTRNKNPNDKRESDILLNSSSNTPTSAYKKLLLLKKLKLMKNKISEGELNVSKECNDAVSHFPQFRIRTWEEADERYTRCFGSCPDNCDGQHGIKDFDWSVIHADKTDNKKENVPVLKDVTMTSACDPIARTNITAPNRCYLNAVQNSVHFASRDEDVRWLPAGNITKKQSDRSQLILRRLKESMTNHTKDKRIIVPQNVLEMLTANESFTRSSRSSINTSESPSEIRFANITEDATCTTGDSSDPLSIKDTETDSENIQRHFRDCSPEIQNDYAYMKPTTKIEILRKWAKKSATSSGTSDLDSDDLTPDHHPTHPSSPNEQFSYDELSTSLLTTETNESIGIIEQNLKNLPLENPPTFDDNSVEECENLYQTSTSDSIKSNEQNLKNTPADEPLTLDDELPKEHLTLSTTEANIESAIVPVSFDTSSKPVPVFNDLDMESDEEEWDVHVELHHFKKNNTLPDVDVENGFENELDVGPKIVEISETDGSQGNTTETISTDPPNTTNNEDRVNMKDLMLYVEENLLYVPERCYADEPVLNNDNKTCTTKEPVNGPLVTPQSTIVDMPQNVPPGFTLPATNPLILQNVIKNANFPANITSQELWKLWIENFQIQLQIAATFQLLYPKMIADNSQNNLSNAGNQKPAIGTNYSQENNSSNLSNSNAKNYDFANVKNSNVNSMLATADCQRTQSYSTSSNDHIMSVNANQFNLFNNMDKQQSTGNFVPIDWNPRASVYKNDVASTFLTDAQLLTTSENIHTVESVKASSKIQNFNRLNNNDNNSNWNKNCTTLTAESNANATLIKETNPFKLSLAGKLEISDSPNDFVKDQNAGKSAFVNYDQALINGDKSDHGYAQFPAALKENVNSNVKYDNFMHMTKSTSYNLPSTSLSAINDFILPASMENLNIDEGYLTRPSTAQTRESSSPFVQPTRKVEYNVNHLGSTAAETWLKSLNNVDPHPSSFVQREQIETSANQYHSFNMNFNYDGSQQRNGWRNSSTDVLGSHVRMNDARANMYPEKESELRDIWSSQVTKEM